MGNITLHEEFIFHRVDVKDLEGGGGDVLEWTLLNGKFDDYILIWLFKSKIALFFKKLFKHTKI